MTSAGASTPASPVSTATGTVSSASDIDAALSELVTAQPPLLVVVDFDGTLAPIVEDPTQAHIHPDAPDLLEDLLDRPARLEHQVVLAIPLGEPQCRGPDPLVESERLRLHPVPARELLGGPGSAAQGAGLQWRLLLMQHRRSVADQFPISRGRAATGRNVAVSDCWATTRASPISGSSAGMRTPERW